MIGPDSMHIDSHEMLETDDQSKGKAVFRCNEMGLISLEC